MRTHRIECELTDRDVSQLRQLMDALPLNPCGPLITKVLPALPFESDAVPSSSDRSLLDLKIPGSRGGVSLADQLRAVFQTSHTLSEPLDPRRGEPAIADSE